VIEFIELGGGDVAGAVLGDEAGIENADYLLVDPGRRARERFRGSPFHPGREDEILNGSNGHGVASFWFLLA
jgi:hypothetical protein